MSKPAMFNITYVLLLLDVRSLLLASFKSLDFVLKKKILKLRKLRGTSVYWDLLL